MLSRILILSIVVGVCIGATITSDKQSAAPELLKTAESNSRQFGGGFGIGIPFVSFGGYGGYGHYPGGFGGYGGYGGSWGGHNQHGGGGYGGYGHVGYPNGGGYGHGHHHG